MNISKVSRRYAKALFLGAMEAQSLEQVKKDIQLVAHTYENSRQLKVFLKNPAIHTNLKKSSLKAIFQNRISQIVLNFLIILVTRKREEYLSEIAHEFEEHYKESKNIKTAIVWSAAELSDGLRSDLQQHLSEQINATIELKEHVNKKLIGGIIVKIGDREVDLSLSRQIRMLSRNYSENIYEGKI